ncbi:MAG TPA: hypothetical protein PLR67_02490 [Candidatus Dojkabacteria bacterium]|nr:hypothetical protein [Candidatus Dojkabacteria bacterium]
MAEEKKAKKIYTLEEIKFNEANKAMSILACIPIVGLILLFVEKEDKFVRYMGAQFTLVGVLQFFFWIPVIGLFLLAPLTFLLIIIGMVKASQGQRFDIPLLSDLGLKLMAAI